MYAGRTVALIVPALDEEEALGPLLAAVERTVVDRLIVVDNGSTDGTADVARRAGALVVSEPRRGYGRACLAGIAAAEGAEWLAFMDGDGSDDPTELPALLRRLEHGAELVVGSRVLGGAERGALTPLQRFGNALTCTLVRAFWGVRFTDLGPFRAISAETLRGLEMRDPDYGWTIEMQVKAAQRGLRCEEVPVRCRVRRGGRSKVSGTVKGSLGAGRRILGYVLSAKVAEWGSLPPSRRRS